MKYALGNMLNGAGGLNPDGLALDLQFAADKTLTARRGPTPVLTRASTATFVGSDGLIQSAAINAPRFDHDPVTRASRGLLIEESRTNLCLRSADVGAWTGTFSNSGSTTAPDGTSAGYLAGIGTGNCQTINTANVTGSHALSVYLKRNNTDWVRMQGVQGANINVVNLWVNLATGAIGTLAIASGTPTSLSAQVTPAGDGWYRCSITASYPATNYLNINIISATADNSVTRVSGSIYGVWGAQVEAGSFATSYIPTTTASLVRSADVCSISGADFTSIWNGVDATVFFRGSRIANQAGQNSWSLSSNSLATNVNLNRGTTLEFISVGGTGIISTTEFSIGSEYKTATALRSGNYAASFNGAAAIVSSNSFALVFNTLTIGSNYPGNGQLNGWIHNIKFYKKRLPNAKLQALTV